MKQKITLSLDKELIGKVKVMAAHSQTSISRMLSDELKKVVEKAEKYELAKGEAMNNLKTGFHFGGNISASREDLYER